mgnify:CR=1 FL=1
MKPKGLIFILVMAGFNAAAQDFNGGLKAGIDFSQVDGDRQEGYHKGGLIFGGFVSRKLSPRLNWQLEMIYIMKGSKKGADSLRGIYDYKRIGLNYVEMPMVMQVWYEKFKLYFEGGLSFGVLISSKEEDENGTTTLIGPFNPFEFGLVAGASFIATPQLSASARFGYSILPIANQAIVVGGKTYGGSYNNLIELTLNYLILRKEE